MSAFSETKARLGQISKGKLWEFASPAELAETDFFFFFFNFVTNGGKRLAANCRLFLSLPAQP